jgi:GYF domain 2
MIWIAHNGQEIGQFSASQLIAMWAKGEVHADACYWLPGMAEWRPVEEVLAYDASEAVPQLQVANEADAPKASRAGSSGKPNKSHLNFLSRRGIDVHGLTRMAAAQLVEKTKQEEKLRRNLATPKQRACLEYHGVSVSADLGRDEASAILDGLDLAESKWMQERHLKYPHLYEAPSATPMTARQKAFLDFHGIKCDEATSGQDASKLIQNVIDDPAQADSGWNERKTELYPHLFNEGW